jgi:hypothetical protein
VFEEHGNGVYSVGFSVKSKKYEMWQSRNIVIYQWTNTTLFERDVGKQEIGRPSPSVVEKYPHRGLAATAFRSGICLQSIRRGL